MRKLIAITVATFALSGCAYQVSGASWLENTSSPRGATPTTTTVPDQTGPPPIPCPGGGPRPCAPDTVGTPPIPR